jgi:hypothetical protein
VKEETPHLPFSHGDTSTTHKPIFCEKLSYQLRDSFTPDDHETRHSKPEGKCVASCHNILSLPSTVPQDWGKIHSTRRLLRKDKRRMDNMSDILTLRRVRPRTGFHLAYLGILIGPEIF